MHFFAWLFGRKESPVAPAAPPKREPAVAVAEPKPAPPAVAEPKAPPAPAPRPAPSEADNLGRWKASGQPREWVEARCGKWDHDDWLRLLAELQASPYWPMQPEAIGAVLEEHKREWLNRN